MSVFKSRAYFIGKQTCKTLIVIYDKTSEKILHLGLLLLIIITIVIIIIISLFHLSRGLWLY